MRGIYLSGAPRLSTRADTESLGPRAHMLGVIGAFRSHGIDLDQFIVGDRVPESFGGSGSERRLGRNPLTVLAADALRLLMRVRSRLQLSATARHTTYDFAYERYALFQELGSSVPRRPFWILEVNALLAAEATSERRATSSRRLATTSERRTLRRADLIVAVTDALKAQIVDAYAIPPEKILVVENGVDAAKYAAPSGPTRPAMQRLGFLGALYQWQNVGALLEAMSRSGSTDLTLSVAGDGPERPSLEQAVAAQGLGDRVSFLGRIHPDAVPAFLEDVDVCFAGHTSSNGAYFSPLKLWEYLAAGKVIIASRHDATRALEEDGFPVVTYAGSDPAAVAEAISRVRDRFGELTERAQECRHRVLEEFSWEYRLRPVLERIAEETGGR